MRTGQRTCRSCQYLRAFELSDELFTCHIVNIRLHVTTIRTFGCNYHERKPRKRKPAPPSRSAAPQENQP